MDVDITFGAWLKRRRRQLDLTQKELAYQAGYSVGTIRKMESDERRPSMQLAAILSQQLDIPPEQHEAFVAFARAEPYTADINVPVMAPVEEQTPSIPALPQLHSPPETPPLTVNHNLPLETTQFVGREPELATLDDLFTNLDSHLVTLVGPGGIGKTRLALAYAEQVLSQSQFPNGVFFVNLAPVLDAERMVLAMAEALNLSMQSAHREKRSPKDQLLDYLRDRRLFLLLDNFEHLLSPAHPQDTEAEVDGAALVAEILQNAPEIRILVTSRERLNLHMEQLFAIDGLAYPDWETAAPEVGCEDVAEYTAVQLFLQAAQRNQQNFSLETHEELSALVSICRMVGGMPLALELAASWVDTLSLMDIAIELQRGLDLLETELSDIPRRQRSVRATFDNSWRKLDEREQSIFALLSIFRGGFTRPAVQAVTGATMRDLSRLVNKSFIQFDKQRDRYQIHELLRHYGAEKLGQDSKSERTARDRHSTYYCQTLAMQTGDLKGARQRQALSTIESDIENVRLAWNRAVTCQNLESIGVSQEALRRFYWNIGWLIQGVSEFEYAVTALRTGEAIGERGIILGRLLASLGRFYGWIGRPEKTIEVAGEGLSLLRRLGAREETLTPLLFLADFQESPEESNRLAREGLALAREYDDQWAIGHALFQLAGNAQKVGDYEQAEQLRREALKQHRQIGNVGGIAWALYWLSILVTERGRYEEALTLARETASIAREYGFPIMGPRALGIALYALGEYVEAEEQFQQGLRLLKERGLSSWARVELLYLGKIAYEMGDFVRAAQQYHEGLPGAFDVDNLELTPLFHDAQGILNMAKGDGIQAREQFLAALQAARRPTTLLAIMTSVAELFNGEGDLEYAALLAMLITNQSASQAKIKERGARLLARLEAQLSANDLANIRQRSRQSDLNTMAAQLLIDLKTP